MGTRPGKMVKTQEKAEYIYNAIRHYIWGDILMLKGEDSPEYKFIAHQLIKTNDNQNIIIIENNKTSQKTMSIENKDKSNIRITSMNIENEKDFNLNIYTKIRINSILWIYPNHITTNIIENLYNMINKYGMLCIIAKKKKLDDDILSDIIFHSGFDEIRRFYIFRVINAPIKIINFIDRLNGHKNGKIEVIIYAKNH